MLDTAIAAKLRAAGLEVKEVAGWKTRGRELVNPSQAPFNPKGGVNHHTATPASAAGDIPSLRILIEGRSDVPGPLCNVGLSRSGVFYVIAAGVANHAGLPDGGVCRGMTGNSTAYGLEIEHPGRSPLEAHRVRLAARFWAALMRAKGLPASQVVQHWEWAPSRKIDLATNMHGRDDPAPHANAFRRMIEEEIARMNRVTAWTVSYLNTDRERVTKGTRNPASFYENHKGAFQRGKVIFVPKRA